MKSVLVVDDDLETRDAIAALLEEEGYPVRIASDGTSALDQLASGEVALALVDLLMPNMNGWALLEELSAHERLGHVPVVVLTALSRVSLPDGIPLLRKPFELDALLQTVKQAYLASPPAREGDGHASADAGAGAAVHAHLASPARSQRGSGVYPLGLAKCGDCVAAEDLPRAPARRS